MTTIEKKPTINDKQQTIKGYLMNKQGKDYNFSITENAQNNY